MSWRTVVISSSAKLDYQMGYLIVRNQDVVKIHISEISILMIETTSVSLTAALLCELTKKKIKVVFCDEKRNPSSELIPYYGSHDTSMKVRKQIAWSEDIKTSVWTEIVTEKIRKQAENLERWDRTEAQMLYEYITQIEFGDAKVKENNMPIEYKRLTEKELNIFINMRINQLREEGAKEEIDLFPALKEYYTHHMKDGTFVSWLAFDGENIVGTSGMSFVEKPPYFGCPTGKIGLLSSMFTNPDYRRKGIAKELLSRVVNDAREYGCGTVQITASDMGVKLYTNFGFVHNDNFMQYKI